MEKTHSRACQQLLPWTQECSSSAHAQTPTFTAVYQLSGWIPRCGLSYSIIRYIQLSGMAQEQRGPDNRGSTVHTWGSAAFGLRVYSSLKLYFKWGEECCTRISLRSLPCLTFLKVCVLYIIKALTEFRNFHAIGSCMRTLQIPNNM